MWPLPGGTVTFNVPSLLAFTALLPCTSRRAVSRIMILLFADRAFAPFALFSAVRGGRWAVGHLIMVTFLGLMSLEDDEHDQVL